MYEDSLISRIWTIGEILRGRGRCRSLPPPPPQLSDFYRAGAASRPKTPPLKKYTAYATDESIVLYRSRCIKYAFERKSEKSNAN